MTRTTLAVAADYADAMLVARRWKNIMVLLLLLFLLIQVGLFLAVRFSGDAAAAPATTQPVSWSGHDLSTPCEWLINVVDFLSIICVVVLAIVLLLIVAIMLVGRLIGVARVTGAFVGCVILAALLFPWQSLWDYPVAGTDQTAPPPVENLEVGPRFGLPGVLYTWPELRHRAHFPGAWSAATYLGWARFVGWPGVAMILLLSVQARSSRGLRFALGEVEMQVAEVPPTTRPAEPS